MGTSSSAPAANQPHPLLINAVAGTAIPPFPLLEVPSLAPDLPGSDQRIANSNVLGTDYSVREPNDLTQAGWGILFASDADPAIQAHLQPLIDLRQSQVQDPLLFKVFSGSTGVLPGQTAASWAQQRHVSLTSPVDPGKGGVPFYLLIVGSPDRISFEFQALLKMQWAVGRLYFDNVEDYALYAQKVVEYESRTFTPVQSKNTAMWVTRNYGDAATAILCNLISDDFLDADNMLGAGRQFGLNSFMAEKATKAQLIDILRGNVSGGAPAVIFTGSHGCEYSAANPDTQRRLQGAFATQEWVPGTPASPANQFSADDIPPDAKLQGTMGFLFACFSGGCPVQSSYYVMQDCTPVNITPAPMIASLPQALLSRGMLALIAHVDMAFPYAFQDTNGTPQTGAVRTPLELLMEGKRAGLAADQLSILWSARAAELAMAQQSQSPAGPAVAPNFYSPNPALGQMTIARDDARNYIVLGDPATQLRISDLK
jgi:hypothetical protein